jgi:hypothetical protein
MGIEYWITLAVAVLALILAAVAIVGIHILRQEQCKRILLDDLAEWATDLLLCASILDKAYIAREMGEKSHRADLIAKWSAEIDLLMTRIEYMEDTSSAIGHRVHEHVAKVRESLDKYRGLVLGQLDGKIGEERVLKELAAVNLGVRKLLQEIKKTKIRHRSDAA